MDYLDFGTPISFGWTAQYLPQKSATRRDWKDTHAAKFIKAWSRAVTEGKKLRVPAIDKGYHAGGKQIGWLLLNEPPYKEALKNMRQSELIAEGGMCATRSEFIDKYFEGDAEKEVWVIQFDFHPLETEIHSPEPVRTTTASMIEENLPTIPPDSLSEIISFPDSEPEATNHNLKILTSAKSDEHNTPKFLIDAARLIMGGIDLDPTSNAIANRTVRAHQIYTKSDNGLTKPWFGRIWLNPPFSLADLAVPKLIASYESGDVFEAILLLKSAVETRRYQLLYPYPFVELNKRVNYDSPHNKDGAPFATVLFYLGPNFPRFRQIMSDYGRVHPGARLFEELESDRADLLARLASIEAKAMIDKKETITKETRYV